MGYKMNEWDTKINRMLPFLKVIKFKIVGKSSNFLNVIIWTGKWTNMPQYYELLIDFSDVKWSWIILYK